MGVIDAVKMASRVTILMVALLASQSCGKNKTDSPKTEVDEGKAAEPKSGKGPEPIPPTSKVTLSKSKFRSDRKPKCGYKCHGGQKCSHWRIDSQGSEFWGECHGQKCAGVKEPCLPCYKKCPGNVTETQCDYVCMYGDNECKHTTIYPDGSSKWGTCVGTNCNGWNKECGKCHERCPNIWTKPKYKQ